MNKDIKIRDKKDTVDGFEVTRMRREDVVLLSEGLVKVRRWFFFVRVIYHDISYVNIVQEKVIGHVLVDLWDDFEDSREEILTFLAVVEGVIYL